MSAALKPVADLRDSRRRQRMSRLVAGRMAGRSPDLAAPLYPSFAQLEAQRRLQAYRHRRAVYDASGEVLPVTIIKA